MDEQFIYVYVRITHMCVFILDYRIPMSLYMYWDVEGHVILRSRSRRQLHSNVVTLQPPAVNMYMLDRGASLKSSLSYLLSFTPFPHHNAVAKSTYRQRRGVVIDLFHVTSRALHVPFIRRFGVQLPHTNT